MRTLARPRSVRFMVARRTIFGSTSLPKKVAVCRLATLRWRELVAQAAPHALAVDLRLWMRVGRGIGEADVVVGRDQEAGGAGGRVVDGLADLRIDHRDDRADDVPRRAELAQLAGLLDLAQHVLEQVALGVGVGLVQPQLVRPGSTTCVSTVGSSMTRRAPCHEVHRRASPMLGEERKHLVAHEARRGCSPDMPLAQDDQRIRSRGIVVCALRSARSAGCAASIRRRTGSS